HKLAIGIVLLVIAVGSWWFTRQTAPPSETLDPEKRHDPDYIVEHFDGTTMNEQGTPRYHLTARRLTHYPDDDTAHFVEPVLVQYLPNGAQIMTRADAGVMPGTADEILMTGNVRATRSGDRESAGGELRTDRLRVELDRP
ncbi:MAG: LPS export ABC transporter periplasmic protein LptC, partial [Sulfurifustaceae bacterium]